MTPLRVALLDHGQGASPTDEFASGLSERGHDVVVIGGRGNALDVLLDRRGFTTPLTHLPATRRRLAAGHYDIVHAFSSQDAYAAGRWGGCPLVFSCTEPVTREGLADRRLKLRFLRAALEESDAVIVHDEVSHAAVWRWLSLEAPIIATTDAAALEDLYYRLLAQT